MKTNPTYILKKYTRGKINTSSYSLKVLKIIHLLQLEHDTS